MRSGLIIAGGRSTRFGDEDKAVATLGGTPMVRRVADRMCEVVDELVINCREDQVSAIKGALEGLPLPVTMAPDPDPDEGPMAGIRTGLTAAHGAYTVVVACDMPFVDPTLLTWLFDRAEGHDGAVPRLEDGWAQTTQAVYRTEPMREASDRALSRGDRRILAAFDDLDIVFVSESEVQAVTDVETFENLNTREEFEVADSRSTGDP